MYDATNGLAWEDEASSYLAALGVAGRRDLGRIYTPSALVTFILDQAGLTSDLLSRQPSTVLDPACGAGAFLVEVVRRLARSVESMKGSILTPSGRASFLRAVESGVFGVDVDPHACGIARAALRKAVEEEIGAEVPAGLFESNVLEADFLLDEAVSQLERFFENGFDFIVGNPPYVSATRIKHAYKEKLRVKFSTATGRLDLYSLFIEKSIQQLRTGGVLAFITPDKFLLSQTASPLRSLILKETSISTIARFSSHKVFADAATVPCITILEKGGSRGSISLLHCSHQRNGRELVEVTNRATASHSSLSSGPWNLVDPKFLEIAHRIQRGHATLKSKTRRISAGPATGRDSIFVVPASDAASLESDLLRPIARGRDIRPYRIERSDSMIIFPFRSDFDAVPTLIDLKDYPEIRRYLSNYQEELSSRHCVRVWGKAWYDWHDQPACDLAKETKILVPDLACSSRFAVDEGGVLPLHSVYYLIPERSLDPHVCAAILNSKVLEFLVRLLSPRMKDGFSRYRQQFLASLPIPNTNPSDVEKLAESSRKGDQDSIDQIVWRLFGLGSSDQASIVRFLEGVESAALGEGA